MDVVNLHKFGIRNVVANLGTAMTEKQIDLIWRFFKNPIICLDGDASGKKASLRKDKFEQDFGDLIIKGRDSKGNIVTKDSIRKVSYKSKASITEKNKKIDDIEVQDEQQVSDENDESQTKLEF